MCFKMSRKKEKDRNRGGMMKKYDILITKLYACCGNQEEFPDEVITVDTDRMSELLESVFIEEGLLEVKRQ